MKSIQSTSSSTCLIPKSVSSFGRKLVYSRVYTGSEDYLANLAIDLYLYLKNWKIRHPLYDYTMDIRNNAIHLTIIKYVKFNGKIKTNLSV